MAFSSIFKKATTLLGIGSPTLKPPPLDGEIIYCKNNVCVHPPASLTADKDEHHQGYLTIRSSNDKLLGPTLILTWIPNSTLKKNTRSIENSPNKSIGGTTPKSSPRRPRQEFAKTDSNVTTPNTSITDFSPMDSCLSLGLSLGSELCHTGYFQDRNKLSVDSIPSQFSTGSNGNCVNGTPEDERFRQLGTGASGSGIDPGPTGADREYIQNNEKCLSNVNRDKKIGVNVNKFYTENLNKFNTELKNLTKAVLDEDINENSSSAASGADSLTAEEKLTVLLNRKKLHSKAKERIGSNTSNRSVSIEMDGDSIKVTTEELEDGDDDVLVDCRGGALEENNLNKNESKFESNSQSTDQEAENLNFECTNSSPCDNRYNKMLREVQDETTCRNCNDHNATDSGETNTIQVGCDSTTSSHFNQEGINNFSSVPPHPKSLDLGQVHRKSDIDNSIPTPEISITRQRTSSGSSTTTSGPDSEPPSPYSSSPSSLTSDPGVSASIDSPCSPDSMSHNLQFPENALSKGKNNREKKSAKEQVCGVFSVDLSQMRSLRVFYSNAENTQGQIVIASRESQYKILHFHHGGLDKLAEIFQDWSLFATAQEKLSTESDKNYKQFMIVKPQLTDDQCHPEEGVYSMVTEDIWRTHTMDDGIVEDDYQLRKAIFFGGLEPSLRHETWPFLLHYYPFESTFEEREQIRNDKYIEYQDIRKNREGLSPDEQEKFWRTVQCTVEKDVVRTDRSHPYFKGDNNPNIEILKNLLLNYAQANPHFGYTQGMSDLLAPVLAEVQHEVDAFWCFVGLMQKTIFVSSPKDSDMDTQLTYLRELLRLMVPCFYEHLVRLGDDAMELLFCHRWILLCFKREFPEKAALRIWEACWSHYQTDYFHLFICVAIVCIYGDDVIEQGLPADEILLHFSSLACHMSGELVLRKARGLLHEYRKRPVIPCTLHGLCSLCGQGMWDSGHVPTVECVGSHGDNMCPYLSLPSSPDSEGV